MLTVSTGSGAPAATLRPRDRQRADASQRRIARERLRSAVMAAETSSSGVRSPSAPSGAPTAPTSSSRSGRRPWAGALGGVGRTDQAEFRTEVRRLVKRVDLDGRPVVIIRSKPPDRPTSLATVNSSGSSGVDRGRPRTGRRGWPASPDRCARLTRATGRGRSSGAGVPSTAGRSGLGRRRPARRRPSARLARPRFSSPWQDLLNVFAIGEGIGLGGERRALQRHGLCRRSGRWSGRKARPRRRHTSTCRRPRRS